MPPTRITATKASKLHRNYRDNNDNYGSLETRAVIFDFVTVKDLADKIAKKKKIEVADISFACYYGKYGSGDPTPGKCTLIVQFLVLDGSDYSAIVDEIYNFGGARPPKNIVGEQVMPY